MATDNVGTVYVDGSLLFNTTAFRKPVSVTMRASAKVIAVQVSSVTHHAGFIAAVTQLTNDSMSTKRRCVNSETRNVLPVVSDATWKCTPTVQAPQWTETKFNDDSWPQALPYVRNGGKTPILLSTPMSEFPGDAYWISSIDFFNRHLFCRKHLK